MNPFVNPETKEVFFTVLLDWEDPKAMAAEWLEMGLASAAECLAAQLRRDFREEYGKVANDELAALFFRRGLYKVCWQQVAERLLKHYAPRAGQLAGGDDMETV
jgi:hypothetical protein